MPIPLLVPVLATLCLAASSGAGGDGGGYGWAIDVPDNVFDSVDGLRVTGAIDVDFANRRASASARSGMSFTATGWIRIDVREPYLAEVVRRFLNENRLEDLRRAWARRVGSSRYPEDLGLGLRDEWAEFSHYAARLYSPQQYFDEVARANGTRSALRNALTLGSERFYASSMIVPDGSVVTGTSEEKVGVLMHRLKDWLGRSEPRVLAALEPPPDAVELRALTGLPTAGVRVLIRPGGPLRETAIGLEGLERVSFEQVRTDAGGREVWDAWVDW